jgi:hypothetical protein
MDKQAFYNLCIAAMALFGLYRLLWDWPGRSVADTPPKFIVIIAWFWVVGLVVLLLYRLVA